MPTDFVFLGLNTTRSTTTAVNTNALRHCIPAELWMRIMCISAGCVCIVMGGVGNLTTLLSIATVRSLWRFTNINIFLLAFFDFILTTYVCGHHIDIYWRGCWVYSPDYCHFLVSISSVCYGASLYSLALVSYDRYLMVKCGASYAQHESRRTVIKRAVTTFALIFAFICPSVNLHWFTGISINFSSHGSVCIAEIVQYGALYLLVAFVFSLPILVMAFCYVSVLRYQRLKTNVIGVPTTAGFIVTQLKVKKRTIRATLLVSSMFLVLVATSALYNTCTVFVSMFMLGFWLKHDTIWWAHLYQASFAIAWLNSAINPILYAYAMPEFRRAARVCWLEVFSASTWWFGYLLDKAKSNSMGLAAMTTDTNGGVAANNMALPMIDMNVKIVAVKRPSSSVEAGIVPVIEFEA